MNKFKFEKHITELELAFKPLASRKEERDRKLDIYYESFKDADEYLLSKAIKLLQETYIYKSFPLISDIFSAIKSARDSMVIQNEPGSECNVCQGTGWIIRDYVDEFGVANNIAAPCRHCSVGRAVRKACLIKDKYLKKRKALEKIAITVKAATEELPDAELF